MVRTEQMKEKPTARDLRDKKTAEIDKHWHNYLGQYSDNESCWKELHNLQMGQGSLICTRCFAKESTRKDGDRTAKCNNCGTTIWITAGTFFHRARNLHAIFGAIWLIQNGQVVSSLYLSKLANTAQSTALKILKSIYFVIDNSLTGKIEDIGSVHFMGIFSKRSKQTPRKEHPLTEESAYDEASDPDFTGQSDEAVFFLSPNKNSMTEGLSETEKKIYGALASEPNSADVIQRITQMPMADLLICISLMEMKGLLKPIAGGKFATTSYLTNQVKKIPRKRKLICNLRSCCGDKTRTSRSKERMAEKVVGQVFEHVCLMIHGLSRKYLQLYLALYSFTFNLCENTRPSLFAWCLQAEYVSKEKLADFVSPLNVRLIKKLPQT